MKVLRVTSPVVTVPTERFPTAIAFYEELFGEKTRARLKNPAATLDLALIGSMLLIGGAPAALAAREGLKATLIVDSLDEWRAELRRLGASIIEEPERGPFSAADPIGRFMFVRHPDGHLFEYFQPGV